MGEKHMKWIDILKAKTHARGGGSKPKREKVLSKPEQGRMDQLGEDIRAYKRGLETEQEESRYDAYDEFEDDWDYDGRGGFISEEDAEQWMTKPEMTASLGDVLDHPDYPGRIKIQQAMRDEVLDIYQDFRMYLRGNGFSTAIETANELDKEDYSDEFKEEGDEVESIARSMKDHFYEWGDVIQRLDWNNKTEQNENAKIPALWAVKEIEYEVQFATGKRDPNKYRWNRRGMRPSDPKTNVHVEPIINKPKKVKLNRNEKSRIKDLREQGMNQQADRIERTLLERKRIMAGNIQKPKSKVYLLLYIKGIVTDALDYEFYTLKYTTAFTKDALLQEKMDPHINPKLEIKQGLHRNMLNASKTDVLEFPGEEETSNIINKLRRFFGYYIRA
jgi:hypothetical protein